jgi:hypothetical protein
MPLSAAFAPHPGGVPAVCPYPALLIQIKVLTAPASVVNERREFAQRC